MSGFDMSHVYQFYAGPRDVEKNRICLQNSEFRHAVRVLRYQVGDAVIVVDGKGRRYNARISEILSDRLYAAIERTERDTYECEFSLFLAVGLLKGRTFDWIVEKGTEIGVTGFMPLETAKSTAGVGARTGRWRKIALSAMKQSGRSRLPEITQIFDFYASFEYFENSLLYIAHEFSDKDAQQHLSQRPSKRVVLYVGPEAGFSHQEFLYAREKGVLNLDLGVFRLRTETAALVGAVKLSALAGRL